MERGKEASQGHIHKSLFWIRGRITDLGIVEKAGHKVTHHVHLSGHLLVPLDVEIATTMADIVAEIKKIPPVTRFLVISSLGVTVPAIIGFVPMHKLVFITPLVTKKLEVSLIVFYKTIPAPLKDS